jgi:peptidoglycan/xylan/chitin deacetylase (PgdA/CDA1 family)
MERVFLTSGALPSTIDIHDDRYHVRADTSTPAQRLAALEQVNEAAWALDVDGRASLAARVVAWSGLCLEARESHRVLTADELRRLASLPGHNIGAHSVHHLALTTQSRDTQQAEVAADKTSLESVLGRPVRHFSYPYGDFDAGLVAVVRDAGFRAALTVEAGRVTSTTNRLLLPRVEVTRQLHTRFAEQLRPLLLQT